MSPSSPSSSLFSTTPFHALLQAVKGVGTEALAESLDTLDVSRTMVHLGPARSQKGKSASKREGLMLTHVSWFDVLEEDEDLTEELVLKIITQKRLDAAHGMKQKHALSTEQSVVYGREFKVEHNPWVRAIVMALRRGWLTAATTWLSWKTAPSLPLRSAFRPTEYQDEYARALLEAVLRCPCTPAQRLHLWRLCDTHLGYNDPAQRDRDRRMLYESLFEGLCREASAQRLRVASWLKACYQIREEEARLEGTSPDHAPSTWKVAPLIKKALMEYDGGEPASIRRDWKEMARLPEPLFRVWYEARLTYCFKRLYEESTQSASQALAGALPQGFIFPPRSFKHERFQKKENAKLFRRVHVEWQCLVEAWSHIQPSPEDRTRFQNLLLYLHDGLQRDGIQTEMLPVFGEESDPLTPKQAALWASTLSLENPHHTLWWQGVVEALPLETQQKMAIFLLGFKVEKHQDAARQEKKNTLVRLLTRTWEHQDVPTFTCASWVQLVRDTLTPLPQSLQEDLAAWEARHLAKEMASDPLGGDTCAPEGRRTRVRL